MCVCGVCATVCATVCTIVCTTVCVCVHVAAFVSGQACAGGSHLWRWWCLPACLGLPSGVPRLSNVAASAAAVTDPGADSAAAAAPAGVSMGASRMTVFWWWLNMLRWEMACGAQDRLDRGGCGDGIGRKGAMGGVYDMGREQWGECMTDTQHSKRRLLQRAWT